MDRLKTRGYVSINLDAEYPNLMDARLISMKRDKNISDGEVASAREV